MSQQLVTEYSFTVQVRFQGVQSSLDSAWATALKNARVTLAEDGTHTLIVSNQFLCSIQQKWTVKCINSIQIYGDLNPSVLPDFDLLVIGASAMQRNRNY